MNVLTGICIALLLVSQSASAEAIRTIRVFHTDALPVRVDSRLPAGVTVQVYDMDAKSKADARLNAMVRARLGVVNPASYREANRRAFSEIQNGPRWPALYRELQHAGEAIEFATRLRLRKLPAIVFNDHQVVYGVTSLREAVRIQRSHRGNQR